MFKIINMRAAKPFIGIPADRRLLGKHWFHAVGEKYIDAVRQAADATPILIPALGEALDLDALVERFDGLLLTGSLSNVEPRHYQGPASEPGTLHDPHRDATTLPMIKRAVQSGLPVLGLCRGFQEMNVALGGTLWQDLPSERPSTVDHASTTGRAVRSHGVRIEPGSRLAQASGSHRFAVNSFHHQGVKSLAAGLAASAWADDGLIEGVEGAGDEHWLLGIQWHPEELHAEPGSPDAGMFAALVREALSARERGTARSPR